MNSSRRLVFWCNPSARAYDRRGLASILFLLAFSKEMVPRFCVFGSNPQPPAFETDTIHLNHRLRFFYLYLFFLFKYETHTIYNLYVGFQAVVKQPFGAFKTNNEKQQTFLNLLRFSEKDTNRYLYFCDSLVIQISCFVK